MQDQKISELNDLLPCPFCGNEVRIYSFLLNQGAGILCKYCGAVVFFENKTGLILNMKKVKNKWNTRAR